MQIKIGAIRPAAKQMLAVHLRVDTDPDSAVSDIATVEVYVPANDSMAEVQAAAHTALRNLCQAILDSSAAGLK
jgi:hypothetical protein